MKRLYRWLCRLIGIENIGEESDLTGAGASAEVPQEVIAALDNDNLRKLYDREERDFKRRAIEQAQRLNTYFGQRPWRMK